MLLGFLSLQEHITLTLKDQYIYTGLSIFPRILKWNFLKINACFSYSFIRPSTKTISFFSLGIVHKTTGIQLLESCSLLTYITLYPNSLTDRPALDKPKYSRRKVLNINEYKCFFNLVNLFLHTTS